MPEPQCSYCGRVGHLAAHCPWPREAHMTTLTAERLRELFHYSPETGVFTRLVARGGRDIATEPGWVAKDGYREMSVDGRTYMAHRLVWLYMTGKWPENETDHRDGVRDNNRWENLRDVTVVINQQNQRAARADSRSGRLGVSFERTRKTNPYRVDIRYGGRQHYLGRYPTAHEASEVYMAAKRVHHEGCTI